MRRTGVPGPLIRITRRTTNARTALNTQHQDRTAVLTRVADLLRRPAPTPCPQRTQQTHGDTPVVPSSAHTAHTTLPMSARSPTPQCPPVSASTRASPLPDSASRDTSRRSGLSSFASCTSIRTPHSSRSNRVRIRCPSGLPACRTVFVTSSETTNAAASVRKASPQRARCSASKCRARPTERGVRGHVRATTAGASAVITPTPHVRTTRDYASPCRRSYSALATPPGRSPPVAGVSGPMTL